jgi:predicted unusual protein kinase regulating ubiquinone biosynthesis (AarF/ABC1/UbiB family)
MADERRVPTGRLGRLAKLVGVGARSGASLLFSKDGAGAAEHAAAVLGSLRGLAAKVGQMASYVDGFLPEQHQEAYSRALATLQAAAPRSSFAAIRTVIEAELGTTVEEAFAELEHEPFASASIGQVYRARLHDGRRVAVKVQHPGIDRAIEADLSNASVMQNVVGMLAPKSLDVKGIYEVVRERFREELDYELEADRQEWFARLHEGDAAIRIPEIVRERSRKRVLTSVLAQGRSLAEILGDPEEKRREYVETMWRFVFRGILVGGMFNADPHPGNYVFGDDHVVFLDFGCVQPVEGNVLACARQMHRSAIAHDEAGFRRACAGMLGTKGGAYEDAVLGYTRRGFSPLFESPYRIRPGFVASNVREIQGLKALMFKRDDSVVGMPPALLFMNRLQFGFFSVLAKLDVEVDFAAIERDLLATVDAGAADGFAPSDVR